MPLQHARLGKPLQVVAVLALAGALACAARQTKQQPMRTGGWVETLPDGTKVACRMEMPIGSHIAEPNCQAVADIERAREQTQTELLVPRGSPGRRD